MSVKAMYTRKLGNFLAILDTTKCFDGEGYEINRINVPNRIVNGKNLRGQGHGHDLLVRCLADADASGSRLVLGVSPSDGLTREQLITWYGRHGFVPIEPNTDILERLPK
jgi:predicted GNAT family N-acyltransferase